MHRRDDGDLVVKEELESGNKTIKSLSFFGVVRHSV